MLGRLLPRQLSSSSIQGTNPYTDKSSGNSDTETTSLLKPTAGICHTASSSLPVVGRRSCRLLANSAHKADVRISFNGEDRIHDMETYCGASNQPGSMAVLDTWIELGPLNSDNQRVASFISYEPVSDSFVKDAKNNKRIPVKTFRTNVLLDETCRSAAPSSSKGLNSENLSSHHMIRHPKEITCCFGVKTSDEKYHRIPPNFRDLKMDGCILSKGFALDPEMVAGSNTEGLAVADSADEHFAPECESADTINTRPLQEREFLGIQWARIQKDGTFRVD